MHFFFTMISFLYIIIGLVLLVFGGDWLLKAAVGISLKLNLSKVLIGMTVVSFCTSAPELIVSLKSAIDGFPDIALGNVVGSNIANVGLILGVVAIICPMQVHEKFIKKDWLQMLLASFILYFILFTGYEITRLEGIVTFGLLIVWIIYMLKTLKPDEPTEEIEEISNIYKILGFLIIGVLALYFGSDLLITGAVDLAKTFGVSERIIGVTVVAVGTSIPELAASVIAALKKESAIAIGNVVGSNIFNILGVLGLTSIIHPIKMDDLRLFSFDLIWMLAFAFILLPLVLLPKKGFIDRKAGLILVLAYGVFVFMTFS
jgi:cation:H+ antiporter